MKPYSELSENIRQSLAKYCVSDPYGLKPETLYQNIMSSSKTCSPSTLSSLFEVSELVILELVAANNTH